MIIGSIHKDVRFHSWPEGQLISAYKPKNSGGVIKSMCWSKDGNWLVVVPPEGKAQIISIKNANVKLLHSIQDVQLPTYAAFSNGSKRCVALGSATGVVVLYDVKSKNSKKPFSHANSGIFKLEYTAKDSHLAVGCSNGELLLYNTTTSALSGTYAIPSEKVSNFRCHPNKRNLIAGGSNDGTVVIWDTNVNKAKSLLNIHVAPITDLAFSPIRSDLIVSAGYDRKCCFHDTRSNKKVMQFTVEKNLTSIDFCNQGVNLAVADQTGNIFAYDTRKMSQPIQDFNGHNGLIQQILFQKTLQQQEENSLYEIKEETDSSNTTPSRDYIEHSFPLFGEELCNSTSNVVTTKSLSHVEDSFIVQLGVHSKTRESEPNNSIPDVTEKKLDTLSHKINMKEITASSTPNFCKTEIPNYVDSPIIASSCEKGKQEAVDVSHIKEIIQQELTKTASDIRKDLYSFQWYVVKEFMKTEESFANLQEKLVFDENFENNIIQEYRRIKEENVKLKKILKENNLL